jgi:MBG domain
VHGGSYAVVATVTQAGYSGSASGTLVIAPVAQTITFGPLAPGGVGGHVPLTATASSGLAVSFGSSNTTVATVSGNVATLLAAGTTTITASQPGSVDYQAAAPVAQPLAVSSAGPAVPAVPLGPKLALAGLLLLAGAALIARRTSRTRSRSRSLPRAAG